MSGPVGTVNLKVGDKVNNYQIKKKLGEGACGIVFLVSCQDKDGKVSGRAAMKVEPRMKRKEDEILRMEIYVMNKLQQSRHVPKLLASGQRPNYTFVVMSLLGRELFEIRRRLPGRKMSASSVLRITIQLIKGFQDIHEAGFVHRDTKSQNMAMGFKNPLVVYIFDFGLARQILIDDAKTSKKVLRPARSKVMFRGTSRYCSLNIHRAKDAGRHDDLYGVLYSCIESITGTLPWKGKQRKESEKLKATTTEEQLCQGCPPSFLEIAKKLKQLTYTDTPPYMLFMDKLKKDLPKGSKMTDPYEWTKPGQALDEHWEDKTGSGMVSEREAAEIDRAEGADKDTSRDCEESAVTEDQESNNEFDPAMSKDDTLDDL